MRESLDVFHVQRRTSECAARIGFEKRACGELAIVASELASNIVKYGVRGSIELTVVEDEHGRGLSLVASDSGPQFHDLASAVQDGWDDRGPIDPLEMLKRKGIGGGLGAVLRFSHTFRVEPAAVGKRIYVVRYLIAPKAGKRT